MVTKETLEEAVLDFSQRRKRAQTLRKFASKIQMARQRALKRMATTTSIEHRAQRAAIKIVRKIVAGKLGMDYTNLSVSQKMAIDAKVQTKKKLIGILTVRLIPKMRKAEIQRLAAAKQPVTEAAGAGEEGTDELVNTYVGDTPYQTNPITLNAMYFQGKYGAEADKIMRAICDKNSNYRLPTMKTSERARKTDDG